MNIEELTIKEAREIVAAIGGTFAANGNAPAEQVHTSAPHQMLGRRCVVRTYSAGVHIGTVKYVNPANWNECVLTDALRLWKWTCGGLSLSAVAKNGIKGGRLNREAEIALTNAIEYIPTTQEAEATYGSFVED